MSLELACGPSSRRPHTKEGATMNHSSPMPLMKDGFALLHGGGDRD